jgi:hypothetical protein
MPDGHCSRSLASSIIHNAHFIVYALEIGKNYQDGVRWTFSYRRKRSATFQGESDRYDGLGLEKCDGNSSWQSC